MFKVKLQDKTLIEGENCPNWDAVPKEGIKELALIVDGKPIILPQCDKYFYSIEAISRMGLNSAVSSKPVITAYIIGGIINDKAIYIRQEIGQETKGGVKISIRDKKELTFAPFVYHNN